MFVRTHLKYPSWSLLGAVKVAVMCIPHCKGFLSPVFWVSQTAHIYIYIYIYIYICSTQAPCQYAAIARLEGPFVMLVSCIVSLVSTTVPRLLITTFTYALFPLIRSKSVWVTLRFRLMSISC